MDIQLTANAFDYKKGTVLRGIAPNMGNYLIGSRRARLVDELKQSIKKRKAKAARSSTRKRKSSPNNKMVTGIKNK